MSEKTEKKISENSEIELLKKKITTLEQILSQTQDELSKIKCFYDTTFATLPDILIIINLTTEEIIKVNESFLRASGYSKEETIGNTSLDLNLWEKIDDRRAFISILKSQGELHNFESTFRIKNGEIRICIMSSKLIKIGDDSYNISIIKDITEQKKFEQELRIAKENAEKSDKLKSEFLAQMSHEIRTPVNTILSFSSMLKNELSDIIPENMRFGFQMIDNGGRRLIRTIELILSVSELHTGTYKASKKNVNIHSDVLLPIIKQFENLARDKGIDLLFKYNGAEKSVYYGDQYTITQLYLNLIDNAIKYTHRGKVSVRLKMDENNKISSIIEDTGIGMSEEFMKTLYIPFSQEESGYTRKYEGTGLGLSMVKQCCEINNIDINVESAKGEGTKVTLNYA